MLAALTTKIISAIMPLRLEYFAEHRIDRSLRRGLVEAAELSVISVVCAGVCPAYISPFDLNLVGDFVGGVARATKTKGAGWMPAPLFVYISSLADSGG